MGMVAGAGSAAAASIGEREKTEGYAVLGCERRHGSLLDLVFDFEIWTDGKERARLKPGARTWPKKQTPRGMAWRSINQKNYTMTIIMLPTRILD